MISVIITSSGEQSTLPKAIAQVIPQIKKTDEILIVSPDVFSPKLISTMKRLSKNIYWIRDKGIGKPAALNLALKEAHGDIFVLTDGDVYIDSLAISKLLERFEDKKIGLIGGRPVSINPKNNIFGYWSHVLTNVAHNIRINFQKRNQFFECSGYLLAFRSGLVEKIPEDTLAEDAVISHLILSRGYKIGYSSLAKVYVRYPSTYSDWLKQKIRSAGGYSQRYIRNSQFRMRSFSFEVISGSFMLFNYVKGIKQFSWVILLMLARIHAWLLILVKVNILRESFSKIWVRVESTKY